MDMPRPQTWACADIDRCNFGNWDRILASVSVYDGGGATQSS